MTKSQAATVLLLVLEIVHYSTRNFQHAFIIHSLITFAFHSTITQESCHYELISLQGLRLTVILSRWFITGVMN